MNLADLLAVVPSPLPDDPPIDPASVSPGLLGLAAFLFLVVAVALLYRSMRNQMKKVNPGLPSEPPREPTIPVVDSSSSAVADSPTDSDADSSQHPVQGEGEPPARG